MVGEIKKYGIYFGPFQLASKDIRICAECHEFIGKLHYFTEKCDKATALFNKILHSNCNQQNDVNYLQSLRYDAGIDEEKVMNTLL